MAARSSQASGTNPVDGAASAFNKLNIGDKPTHPALRSAASAPSAPGRGPQLGLGGLAARRAGAQAPRLKDLSGDMGLHPPLGGGPSGAGLGGGRPMMDEAPKRSPQATWGTPFANFGKIVFVPFL